jgi:hypothetical protein
VVGELDGAVFISISPIAAHLGRQNLMAESDNCAFLKICYNKSSTGDPESPL